MAIFEGIKAGKWAQAVILLGRTIGEGAVFGKDVPAKAIVGVEPANIIKKVTNKEILKYRIWSN